MNHGTVLWRDAFNPITELRREFDRLFDDCLTPTQGLRTDSQFVPACEIEEADDHYLLALEVAGVKKDDIKMEVIDNQIVISGERRNNVRKKEDGHTYSERRFGRFQRTFALPIGVDTSQIEANYEDGILRVVVPKAESSKPRQIKIASGAEGTKFLGKLLGQTREKEEHPTTGQRVAS